ncbi:MAG: D-alanyl-D-alanine endopeptidase [Betaproteobacteria bacterium]|nr:D-alanyl-D-alanine endopeptidase [Betaproteobacteria bacterium]
MKRLLPVVFASLVAAHAWATPTTPDPARLKLGSANALVIDAESDRPIYAKAADDVTPIASVTKLMTAMVVLDANQPMDAPIEIDKDDIDYLKGSHSRLGMGATLSRREMLRLALMSSENRAASSLARYYPGGTVAAVAAMNRKAAELGMTHTHYADPTGLSPQNVSTAVDLAKLVQTAATYPLIRQFTTTPEHSVEINPTGRTLGFLNSNALVRGHAWDIMLQKTGYINEAGRCVVMLVNIASKPFVIVLLDSFGKYTRIADAQRVKYWLETGRTLALGRPRRVHVVKVTNAHVKARHVARSSTKPRFIATVANTRR